MRTQNEESNTQHSLPRTSVERTAFDREATPAGYAIGAGPANEAAKAEGTTQGGNEKPPKERDEVRKSTRAEARKIRSEEPEKNPDPTMAAAKPARVKRTSTQPAEEVKNQAEAASKPKRPSSRKMAKVVEVPALPAPAGGEIPPITPAAIELLGKQDATAADVLKLAPESLAFVQYHFKYLQQLEANSQLMNAYLIANARPVSPAFQHFADALGEHGIRDRNVAVVQTAAEVPESEKRQTAHVAIPSYRQKAATTSAYNPVDVQLPKHEIDSGKSAIQTQTSEPTPDDHKRAYRVIGTAHILMSAPSNDLTLMEVADLVASDVEELHAIKDIAARRLALNAMVESGLAQPRYQAELAKQAPELVGQANQAHKAMKADWGIAYEVSTTLSYLADAEKPLTKDETAVVAKKTIEAIRAIKGQQYRQETLALSHQIGHWQPLYKVEFARQAPDLVTLAEAAYKTQEARATAGWKVPQALDNSIERSPVQLVMAAQQGSTAPLTASTRASTTAKESVDKPAASAAPGEQVGPNPTPALRFSERLGLALGGVANWASSWLPGQGKASLGRAAGAKVSLDKSAVSTVPVDDKSAVVPESVARRFLRVEREYYFRDKRPAFSDRGNKLATRGTDPEVVHSLIEIARARGWDTITVKGTEDFRRSAWMEATQNGLNVDGYKPTAIDLAALANRPANNTVEKGSVQTKSSVPTQSTADQPAVKATPAQPAAPAQTVLNEPAPRGTQPDTEFAVKAKAFQKDKPAFVVEKYPDLAAAYGIVAAAKAFAADKLPEAARKDFVEMARLHMVEKIMAGQQIQGPKIYLAPTKTIDVGDQTKTAAEAVDRGKSPRTKAVEKER
ncbi:LPD7 domain-containing protein [Massilia sp. X63]|uniref:LPD7 domain-containing protein n=1 Tax=Massilia sp. X63 TaxID=3237285 RepID=UPI0034DD36A1